MAPWRRAPAFDGAGSVTECSLARCSRCGTAVTLDCETPGWASAPGPGSPAGDPRLGRIAAPVLARFDRRRLRMLAPAAAPPGRLLDVGAGRGRFVAAARRRGYEARGMEPDAARAAAAGGLYGAPVAIARVEDAAVDPDSLDAACLWHVLEHLDDPEAGLRRVAGWLRPGGALLVGVPNLASAQAALAGPRWFHLDLPRHRTHFTPRGLEALLERCGFERLSTHHVLAEHNPYGMWQSLVNRVTPTPSYLFHLLRREVPVRPGELIASVVALPLAPLAALVELAAGLAGRGGTIAVVARRTAGPNPAHGSSNALAASR